MKVHLLVLAFLISATALFTNIMLPNNISYLKHAHAAESSASETDNQKAVSLQPGDNLTPPVKSEPILVDESPLTVEQACEAVVGKDVPDIETKRSVFKFCVTTQASAKKIMACGEIFEAQTQLKSVFKCFRSKATVEKVELCHQLFASSPHTLSCIVRKESVDKLKACGTALQTPDHLVRCMFSKSSTAHIKYCTKKEPVPEIRNKETEAHILECIHPWVNEPLVRACNKAFSDSKVERKRCIFSKSNVDTVQQCDQAFLSIKNTVTCINTRADGAVIRECSKEFLLSRKKAMSCIQSQANINVVTVCEVIFESKKNSLMCIRSKVNALTIATCAKALRVRTNIFKCIKLSKKIGIGTIQACDDLYHTDKETFKCMASSANIFGVRK